MITVRKATKHDVQALSKKLLELLENTSSQLYQENVAKFSVPEAYVKQAFSAETFQKALESGKSVIYLALENGSRVLGFAQTVRHDKSIAELDRIVVFPEYTRKGIGSRLLARVLSDEARKGTKAVIVNAGKDETHARRFYEKNGFKQMKKSTVDTPWGSKISLVTYQFELKSQ
jgi:N-acetylglutamate synthase-like GNAT family acetyltransferase